MGKTIPLNISAPGFMGLNTERKGGILPHTWCTRGDNCVIDKSGRVAARKGSRRTNTTTITSSPLVKSIHEYIDGNGNNIVICSAGNKIYSRTATTLTDISGTITLPTADNWNFVNYNKVCVGFQSGHSPIVLTTTGGIFADITLTGTQQPTSSTDNITAAYGRLWAIDGTDLKYSDSLTYTAWNNIFDLSTVWLSGMDEGVAVAEFNGQLIIFGKKSIIIYNNPWSPTGTGTLDTSLMTLVESIKGIGCIARDSIQHIGNDILFLSHTGVRSLSRTIQEKSMPLRDLSKNNKGELLIDVGGVVSLSDIKSAYNQAEGFYLLSLPNINNNTGITYYFDLRQILPDGSAKMMKWDTYFTAMSTDISNITFLGTAGYLNEYTNYKDNILSDGTGGSSYPLLYESPWTIIQEDFQNYLKIPKRAGLILYGTSSTSIVFKWAFDFLDIFTSRSITIPISGALSEFGISEYGIGEFGGGGNYTNVTTNMSKSGRVIKFGIQLTVSGTEIAIQQISIQTKLGKMVI